MRELWLWKSGELLKTAPKHSWLIYYLSTYKEKTNFNEILYAVLDVHKNHMLCANLMSKYV